MQKHDKHNMQVDAKTAKTVRHGVDMYIGNDASIYIYGSRAKGNARKNSDLDILVRGNTQISLRQLAYLNDYYMESDIPYLVDVHDYNATSKAFLQSVKDDFAVI
jgi:predicted nucleotidyltransferase